VTGLIPILLYHSVNDRPGSGDERWTVSRRDFAAHLEVIAASDRRPVTVTEIADGLRRERPLPERPVGISFDDGFADNYRALAELLDRGLAATIFVTTGEIGARNRLSAPQVAELAGLASVEVGAHSVRHRRLDELDEGQVADEVHQSRAQLEEIVQTAVDSFAYPHGAYDQRVRRTVAAAGYRAAAAVKNAVSHDRDDPLAIARWTVTAGTSARRIAEVLEGNAVARAWAGERLRTRASRVARRGRRALSPKVRQR
jgi:peptidoglycan/xylan/chitin deacetylase (PgdA/CDA1 family)